MKKLNCKNIKKKAFVAIIETIFLITLFMIIALITKEVASEISVRTEKNHFSINSRIKNEVLFKIILNNSEEDNITGYMRVENAEPYDEKTPRAGSTIIAVFNDDNEIDFEVHGKEEEIESLKVSVNESAPAGTYSFQLVLIINETEKELDKDLVILTVEPFYDFEIDLDDKYARKIFPGDRVDFGITISNNGNVEEEIKFDLKEYPVDWQYSSIVGIGNIYFSENPARVPIINPNKNETGEKTIFLTIYVPEESEMPKYYECEIVTVELVIRAESINGDKEEKTIRMKITQYIPLEPPPPPPPVTSTKSYWSLGRFLLLLPFLIFLGGFLVLIVLNKKKELNYQKYNTNRNFTNTKNPLFIPPPKWNPKVIMRGKNESKLKATKPRQQKFPAKPTTIKCPNCTSSLTILLNKRPLDIVCPKCNKKLKLK